MNSILITRTLKAAQYSIFLVSFTDLGVLEGLGTNESTRGISIKLLLAVFRASLIVVVIDLGVSSAF